jgi:hypothetical protein
MIVGQYTLADSRAALAEVLCALQQIALLGQTRHREVGRAVTAHGHRRNLRIEAAAGTVGGEVHRESTPSLAQQCIWNVSRVVLRRRCVWYARMH